MQLPRAALAVAIHNRTLSPFLYNVQRTTTPSHGSCPLRNTNARRRRRRHAAASFTFPTLYNAQTLVLDAPRSSSTSPLSHPQCMPTLRPLAPPHFFPWAPHPRPSPPRPPAAAAHRTSLAPPRLLCGRRPRVSKHRTLKTLTATAALQARARRLLLPLLPPLLLWLVAARRAARRRLPRLCLCLCLRRDEGLHGRLCFGNELDVRALQRWEDRRAERRCCRRDSMEAEEQRGPPRQALLLQQTTAALPCAPCKYIKSEAGGSTGGRQRRGCSLQPIPGTRRLPARRQRRWPRPSLARRSLRSCAPSAQPAAGKDLRGGALEMLVHTHASASGPPNTPSPLHPRHPTRLPAPRSARCRPGGPWTDS